MGFVSHYETLPTTEQDYILRDLTRLRRSSHSEGMALQEISRRDELQSLPSACLVRIEAFCDQQQIKLRLRFQVMDLDQICINLLVQLNTDSSDTELEFTRLQDAWSRLVRRHPALRTVFIESANREEHFDQVILKE